MNWQIIKGQHTQMPEIKLQYIPMGATGFLYYFKRNFCFYKNNFLEKISILLFKRTAAWVSRQPGEMCLGKDISLLYLISILFIFKSGAFLSRQIKLMSYRKYSNYNHVHSYIIKQFSRWHPQAYELF